MTLQDLYDLDRSSSRFPDQLDHFLHHEVNAKYTRNLPEDELVGLVNYLDDVRPFLSIDKASLILYASRPFRNSITQASPSGSAPRCCRSYAARGGSSLRPIKCPSPFRPWVTNPWLLVGSVTYSKGRLAPAWKFVSRGSEYAPTVTWARFDEYVTPVHSRLFLADGRFLGIL